MEVNLRSRDATCVTADRSLTSNLTLSSAGGVLACDIRLNPPLGQSNAAVPTPTVSLMSYCLDCTYAQGSRQQKTSFSSPSPHVSAHSCKRDSHQRPPVRVPQTLPRFRDFVGVAFDPAAQIISDGSPTSVDQGRPLLVETWPLSSTLMRCISPDRSAHRRSCHRRFSLLNALQR